ncbi:hypothetical protein PoB_002967500 [Plakobranchus ocellatus]|uniref:Uncharacterized protein n=1 Tax=Plakobranchus ocellatus TaxID=259542 RepID=A0AAV4A705_9GAST|nr:hypothetical protein PoB_002967500 [Plakobranchus ocellatus]
MNYANTKDETEPWITFERVIYFSLALLALALLACFTFVLHDAINSDDNECAQDPVGQIQKQVDKTVEGIKSFGNSLCKKED